MKENLLKLTFDCNPDEDEVAMFYTREFGGKRIVIIPKDSFSLQETDTTFVLTLKLKD